MNPGEQGRRNLIDQALLRHAPKIPRHERAAVLDHATDSPGLGKAKPDNAAWLSLTAYIRHQLTEYDALRDEGYDADAARFFVRDAMNEVLERWGASLRIEGDTDTGDGAK